MDNQFAPFIPIFDLVLCLSQAVDLVSPLVEDHHKRTAQISYGLGLQLKLPDDELRELVIAAALHDVGGLTRKDRLVALDFEYQDPYGHSVTGYLLLKSFEPFLKPAEIVRFHHVPWQDGRGAEFDGLPVPRASHILQLADRVAVLIDPRTDVLAQINDIIEKVRAQAGERFHPRYVEALEALSEKEAFWLDAVYLRDMNSLERRMKWGDEPGSGDDFLGLTNLFRRIIDFRSQFTATHSAGVAAVAEWLACASQFSPADCRTVHLAGLLHDLGKLAVPTEVIEKQGRLTADEFALMRRHTYYTFHLLEPLKVLDVIRTWASFHHERMDGRGYPFHLAENEIPMGARIVTVADIFTALTEDRPYRAGLNLMDAFNIISESASRHQLDLEVVDTLYNNLEKVDRVRRLAQETAMKEYGRFLQEAQELNVDPWIYEDDLREISSKTIGEKI